MKIRVRIPEGVIAVKPMPKAGWALEIVKGKFAKTHTFHHGAEPSEGTKEIVWSGGSLPDAFCDEFVLSGFLSADLKAGGCSTSPSCRNANRAWNVGSKILADGKGPNDCEKPAAGLKLLPKP